ncbi:MAG: hypothetical protein J7485_13205 [Sphingobium sp.]|nr:hypothetical protein [Sphingobium sp.]
MGEVAIAQLRLRRAFRYGYFAFVATIVAALGLFGLWAFSGDAAAILVRSLSGSTTLLIVALALALCVPLFFAAWLIVGASVLGDRVRVRPLMDGVGD